MVDLTGQIAVVTGGGRGLGRAFAQALAAGGAQVNLMARSQAELDQAVDAIGGSARAFRVDVTQAADVDAAFRQIGPVDVLVNNAGIVEPLGPFVETDFDAWWRAMEVNVRGTMLCTHAVLPAMIERRGGRIINLVTGAFSAPYLSAYCASKTAVVRATECLAAEVKAKRVAIFSVAPGTVRTRMSEFSYHSPEGQKWIPWFRRIFDEGLDLPAERPAALVAALASGKYDALSGLFLTPFDDLDAMLADRAEIESGKFHTLQLRPFKVNEAVGAIASIRNSAVQTVPDGDSRN